jgi:hypothetical protein
MKIEIFIIPLGREREDEEREPTDVIPLWRGRGLEEKGGFKLETRMNPVMVNLLFFFSNYIMLIVL